MNRIEEIKGRIDTGNYGYQMYYEDVQYLLSKLETAEKALIDTRNQVGMIDASKGDALDVKYKLAALETISNALKQIRE